MKADIPAFENLAALDALPPRGALVIALPMKIGGGSGGPLRAVAVLPPDRASTSSVADVERNTKEINMSTGGDQYEGGATGKWIADPGR